MNKYKVFVWVLRFRMYKFLLIMVQDKRVNPFAFNAMKFYPRIVKCS